jgi:hypothetical protein
MYEVDDKDEVVELEDAPQTSVGAPCPVVLAAEQGLHLAYYLQNTPANSDGTGMRIADEGSTGEPIALITFKAAYAHMFGPPNDEAFSGHPLAARGLSRYSVSEIKGSSWIRRLERMNSVHPYHRSEHFSAYKHFIFAFHDTTFECIAEEFEVSLHSTSITEVMGKMLRAWGDPL